MMPLHAANRIFKACQFAEISGDFVGESVCREMALIVREFASYAAGRQEDPEKARLIREVLDELELKFDE
jgi:hypothetical protein